MKILHNTHILSFHHYHTFSFIRCVSMAIDVPSVTRLQDSLRKTRENFLRALDEGPDSLAHFASLWCDLQSDIVTARGSSAIDAETDALINLVANDVSALVECFIGIEAASSSCHSRLISEARTVLDAEGPPSQGSKILSSSHPSSPRYREAKPSLQPPRHPTTTPISSAAVILPSSTSSVTESTRSASEPNPLQEFIEHAYKFFVTNIFNPYPTREEKEAIVNKTNNSDVTLASISNWFTNVRRRCGWTDILKRRCNGNRDEMIGLATRVFVKPDPCHPVDPQIITEFMDMKKNIESMYERKTRTSAWIDELEGMTELINPVSQEEQLATKKRETEAEREARKRQREFLKEQRDLERRKQKMQAEALRKAEKVAKQVRREQAQEKRKAERVPRTPTERIDEGSSTETLPSAGGKRKHSLDAGSSYDFSGPRHVSPAYSLSSAGDSDPSSDSRVPSLSWSDSSEERPYKRNRYGFVASSEARSLTSATLDRHPLSQLTIILPYPLLSRYPPHSSTPSPSSHQPTRMRCLTHCLASLIQVKTRSPHRRCRHAEKSGNMTRRTAKTHLDPNEPNPLSHQAGLNWHRHLRLRCLPRRLQSMKHRRKQKQALHLLISRHSWVWIKQTIRRR